MSKKLLRLAAAGIRPHLLRMHQWGVCMPGGAESLVHWRDTMEEMTVAGHAPAVVAFDLQDARAQLFLANAFCSQVEI